jgi:hypothetical protein
LEVQGPESEDTHVRLVEHVLGNDKATSCDKDAMQLLEERSLIRQWTNLVGGERHEDRIKRLRREGK